VNRNAHNSLVDIDLKIPMNILVKDILKILNGPREAGLLSPLWTGDGFYETNCAVVQPRTDVEEFCRRLRANREVALQKLQLCVDEWIDSGKRDDKEAACNRNESRAPQAFLEAAAYWRTSRTLLERSADPPTVRFLPRDEKDFENALWKARRIIALVLSSDLRTRIAKCRYKKCKGPYFLLNRPNKTYEHGLFCCIRHNRAATAPKRIQDSRRKFDARLIDWAAEYVRDHATPAWQENPIFKEELARKVTRLFARDGAATRDNITKNWVTRHQLEIQTKAEQVSLSRHSAQSWPAINSSRLVSG
jgi:hypothetical protein